MLQKSLNAAVLSTLGAMLLVPACAHASVISLDSQSFSLTAPSATNASNTSSFSQFDAKNGVLTGVTVAVSTDSSKSKQQGDLSVTYTKNTVSGTINGTAQSTLTVSAAGVGNAIASQPAATKASITCTQDSSKKNSACGSGGSTTASNLNNAPTAKTSAADPLNASGSASATSALNSYVGTGKVNVTESLAVAGSSNSNDIAANGNTAYSTTASAAWTGTVGLSYTYQDHAAAAFLGTTGNTLNLDFGSVYLGDTVGGLGFSLANLLGDRVALSLISFSEAGDTANLFSTNLANFDDLVQNTSKSFEADFLANTLGKYSATYTLTFADYAPDAASSTLHSGSTLTLNLSGEVLAKQVVAPADAAVPEPASLMLLGLGAAAFGASRKRRQR